MGMMRWITFLSFGTGGARSRAGSAPSIGCADCPIVMSCGLEPREQCLPRLEAIAAGRRRLVGPHDTCLADVSRYQSYH